MRKKPKYFIDTNIFIRALTSDDVKKSSECKEILKKTEDGEIVLELVPETLGEIIYVLTSPNLYDVHPKEVAEKLIVILSLDNINMHLKEVYIGALHIYKEMDIDWQDVVNYVMMKIRNVYEILSYDRDFDKFINIDRVEPKDA
jgi:predicted nucleic acid-binding protein